MRTNVLSLPLAALALGLCLPSAAHAEEQPAARPVALEGSMSPVTLTVTLESRYIETETFNDVFSDKPTLQVRLNVDIGKGFYLYGYAYTGIGTKQPFRDKSSEFGFEAGKEIELSKKTTLTLAAGRFADYAGQGFGHGDWYGKIIVSHGRASVSALALQGETQSVLLSVSYTLPVGKATLRPSVVYFTATGAVNPALDVNVPIAKHLTLGARFVLPDRSGGTRNLYAAGTLTYRF